MNQSKAESPLPSAFILLPWFYHAAIAAPPGMLMPIGVDAGPLCLRSLNQNAVNQTFAPAGVPSGKVTSTFVRPVTPSNFHSDTSVGAAAPTKLKTLAPSVPAGRPRLAE